MPKWQKEPNCHIGTFAILHWFQKFFVKCFLFKPKERLHYNFCQILYLQVSSLEYVLILVQKGNFQQKASSMASIFLLSYDGRHCKTILEQNWQQVLPCYLDWLWSGVPLVEDFMLGILPNFFEVVNTLPIISAKEAIQNSRLNM